MGGSSSKKVEEKPKFPLMKFVTVGLANAGKTSMIYRLKHGVPPECYLSTIGIDFQILYMDGFKLQAWDTASRERSRSISKAYTRGASGIIFMIDSGDAQDFDRAMEFLNEILMDENNSNVVVMVVANKQDLDDAVGPEVIEEKIKEKCTMIPGISLFVMPMSATADDDHSLQLAYRLFVKTMKRKKNGNFQQTGLIPRAWETAEKVAQDSEVEVDDDGEGETKNSNDVIKAKEKEAGLIINPDKKNKSFFIDSIHTFKSLLVR